MELPSKVLEQIAFDTRPKIQENNLVVLDKTIHEKHLSQSLPTYNKQCKIAVTFLTGYNGVFDVTNKFKKFFSQDRLSMMILLFFLIHLNLMKKKAETMKLNEIFLRKVILQKKTIQLFSNQIFPL